MIYKTEKGSHISLNHLVRLEPPMTVNGYLVVYVHLEGIHGPQSVFNESVDGLPEEKVKDAEKRAQKRHDDLLATWEKFFKAN